MNQLPQGSEFYLKATAQAVHSYAGRCKIKVKVTAQLATDVVSLKQDRILKVEIL
jgi:hypothetical protein